MEYANTGGISSVLARSRNSPLPGFQPSHHYVNGVLIDFQLGMVAVQSDEIALPVFEDEGLSRTGVGGIEIARKIVELFLFRGGRARVRVDLVNVVAIRHTVCRDDDRLERHVEDLLVRQRLRKFREADGIARRPHSCATIRIASSEIRRHIQKDRG